MTSRTQLVLETADADVGAPTTAKPSILFAASVLSADFSRLDNELRTVDSAGADWIHVDALGAHLQEEGATSFVKSWNDLLNVISSKTAALQQAA